MYKDILEYLKYCFRAIPPDDLNYFFFILKYLLYLMLFFKDLFFS